MDVRRGVVSVDLKVDGYKMGVKVDGYRWGPERSYSTAATEGADGARTPAYTTAATMDA